MGAIILWLLLWWWLGDNAALAIVIWFLLTGRSK